MNLTKEEIKEILKDALESIKNENHKTNIYKLDMCQNRIRGWQVENMIPLRGLPIVHKTMISNTFAEPLMGDFFTAYLAKAKTFEFDECAFEELYQELLILTNEEKYIFRSIAFITGIQIENEMDFEGIKIIPSNKEYMEYIANTSDFFGHNLGASCGRKLKQISMYDSNAILIYERKAKELNPDENLMHKIEEILEAIILEIGTNERISVSTLETFSYFYNGAMVVREDYFGALSHRLLSRSFSIKNTEEIKNNYKQIKKYGGKKLFLSRLLSAASKDSVEDRYIDLMIAVEALFPEIKSELRYRLSLYVAILLGKKHSDYKSMRDIYDMRSSIVHGSAIKETDLTRNYLLLDTMARALIKTILELLNQGKSLNKIEEDLLKNVLLS